MQGLAVSVQSLNFVLCQFSLAPTRVSVVVVVRPSLDCVPSEDDHGKLSRDWRGRFFL